MKKTIEVMKQMAEALERLQDITQHYSAYNETTKNAIAAGRAEIERLEKAEPYGRFTSDGQGYLFPDQNGMALYLLPAPADESLRIKRLWFADADPAETEYAEEYAAMQEKQHEL